MQLGEAFTNCIYGYQTERRVRDRSRQQRLPGAKRDRAYLDKQLIEQPMVMEIARELTAPDDPDILPVCRGDHLFVHRSDIAAHEPDIGAVH
jgi:hypothetical protein